MKIIQINCVYKKGSTGKIVFDIHTSLQQESYQSIVYYGRGDSIKEEGVFRLGSERYSKFAHLISLFTGLEYGGCHFSTNRLIKKLEQENPDVVHVHCINGYFVNMYRLLNYLKKAGVPTVITQHAEFMYTGGCGYRYGCQKYLDGCGKCPLWKQEKKSFFFDRSATAWQKMKKAMDGFKRLYMVSVSPWLAELAETSTLLRDKRHFTVLNGVDSSNFSYRAHDGVENALDLKNKKIVLHVTSGFNNEIKGGKYVVDMARRFASRQDVVFLVVGAEQDSPLPNLLFAGKIYDQKLLAEYYSAATVTLLTSQYETFSMPVAESLCCGTPVVGFKAGAPERIAVKEYSAFVDYGDADALESELRRWLDDIELDKEEVSRIGRSIYSKEKMVGAYKALYQSIMSEGLKA